MAAAVFIFVALIAFVGGWGLSLLWRGLFPRAKVGAPELGRCPSCGKALDYRAGLKCACGNRARSAEDLYRPVRSAKVVLLGLVVVAAAVGLIAALPWLQAWMAWDSSGARASLWAAAAWGVAGFGGLLIVRALVGEPSRGRRRCPKCWYDLLIDSRTCSECGFTSELERAFYRARRRKGPALLGMAVLVLSYGVFVTPRVREGGWVGAVPTAVLIAGYEWWPAGILQGSVSGDSWTLLERFERADRHAEWERRWFNRRMDALLERPERWKTGQIGSLVGTRFRGREGEAVRFLERAITFPDTPATTQAIGIACNSLHNFNTWAKWSRSADSTQAIIRSVGGTNVVRVRAALTLGQFSGPNSGEMMDAIVREILRGPASGSVAATLELETALSTLAVLTVADPDRAEPVLDVKVFAGVPGPRLLWRFLALQAERGGRLHRSSRARELILSHVPNGGGGASAALCVLYLEGGHDRASLVQTLAGIAQQNQGLARALAINFTAYRRPGGELLADLVRVCDGPTRTYALERLVQVARERKGVRRSDWLGLVPEMNPEDARWSDAEAALLRELRQIEAEPANP
ncbi:MAG: hypothetical protein SFY95_08345 [Planctomycetota bacterium]|nr:hypothetical protein [Planctomycetota bacterium]